MTKGMQGQTGELETVPLFPELIDEATHAREQYDRERDFRAWARRSIRDAGTRQRRKAEKGRPRVNVTVTVSQLVAKLGAQNYCCVLSGFSFRTGDGGTFGPTIPSLDR